MILPLRTTDGRKVGAVRLRPPGTPGLLLFLNGAWQTSYYPNGHVVYMPRSGPSSPSVCLLMVP